MNISVEEIFKPFSRHTGKFFRFTSVLHHKQVMYEQLYKLSVPGKNKFAEGGDAKGPRSSDLLGGKSPQRGGGFKK